MELKWHTKSYEELNKEELYKILQLRARVFVVEQNCPYLDLDDKDQKALHVFASTMQGEIVAYGRLFPKDTYFKEAGIGRVVVSGCYRNAGTGAQLMEYSIDALYKHFGRQAIRISAQYYLLRFYNGLGFIEEGAIYLEDDIEHIAMVKP